MILDRYGRPTPAAPKSHINGFSGARASGTIGFLEWPEPDTKFEVDPMSREEASRKARWMDANIGLVRGIVWGMARQVVGCGLRLQAMTADKEWNKDRQRLWESRGSSASVFDVSGLLNFRQFQKWALARRAIDGDCAVVLAKSAMDRAMFRFYEGNHIGDESRLKRPANEFDGVRTSDQNRATHYRFLRGRGNGSAVLPAQDVILFRNGPENARGHRGMSRLQPAINHVLDRTEILKFSKNGVKMASYLGYYLKASAGPMIGNVSSALRGGDVSSVTVEVRDLFAQGGKVETLPPGVDLATVQDSRPSQNTMELLELLVREVAVGYGVAPELVWNVVALGGANARLVLKLLEPFVVDEQKDLVDACLGRMYVYDTALAIRSGAIRVPEDPRWWLHGWLTPERLTVDIGRDGKLKLELCREGLLTMRDWFGGRGQDWQEEVDQWAMEQAYRAAAKRNAAEAVGLDVSEIFGRDEGSAATGN